MRGKPFNFAPIFITALAVTLASGFHVLSRKLAERPPDRKEQRMELGLAEQLEVITYDARVKLGAKYSDVSQFGRDMATLFIDDEAVEQVNNGKLTYYYAPATNQASADALFPRDWPWPRFLHGQIIRELAAEGAKAIGFDIMFPELKAVRPEESITLTNGEVISS